MNAVLVHPFEKAGLGKAPFRFVGMTEKVFIIPGMAPRAGSSCDYCGTGIRMEFWVASSDDHKFKVGCDCIAKVEAKGSRLLNAAELAIKRAKKTAKLAATKVRVAEAVAALDGAGPEFLTDRLSPWSDGKGGRQTVRSMVEFLLKNGGDKGKNEGCDLVLGPRPKRTKKVLEVG